MKPLSYVEILYSDTSSYRDGISKQEYAAIQHSAGLKLVAEIFSKIGVDANVSDSSVEVNEFGKPYISGGAYFNISHSENVVIAAVSLNDDIGIDIELIRNIEWKEYEEVFTKPEWKMISTSLFPGYSLLELWVKKESILKADGRGMQIPFNEVILQDEYGIVKGQRKNFFLKNIDVENHICYLSCANHHIDIAISEYKLTNFLT